MKRKADGKIYALKKVDINDLSPKEKSNALTEVRILASVKHKNIIAYKECFTHEPTKMLWYFQILVYAISIVMEYADGGDVFSMIKHHKLSKEQVDEDDIWKIFIKAIKAL